MAYRIILADDHAMFRAGLKSLIDKEPDFKVVAQAEDGEDLMEKLESVKCDLVVLDLSMPKMSGMAALQEITIHYPKVKVLVLTMLKDNEHFKQAMKNGASGYVLKDDAYEQLILSIKLIMNGKQFISPAVSSLIADRYVRSLEEEETSASPEILTRRELEILQHIVKGMANKNIAAKLKISVRTVETHRNNLSNKLGIKNTAGLVKYAIAKGIA